MDAKGCRAYLGGMPVQRSDDTSAYDKPRPDIVVCCGPSGRRNFITDPVVIVEVLSPTTMEIDRGEKLRFYKGLPTLRHIALVYQEQVRVEHYRKTEQGWELAILLRPDDELAFEAIRFRIGPSQAYFGVDQTIGGLSARSG